MLKEYFNLTNKLRKILLDSKECHGLDMQKDTSYPPFLKIILYNYNIVGEIALGND